MQIAQDSLWRGRNVLELLLRIGVLFSLFLQIVLIIYGNRRKYWRKNWVLTLVLWIAYQSANLLVTLSLGILFRKDATDESLVTNYAMTALWAPILLVHLGGPDTITGYSLEDNQLWIRHCLGMITQFGVACYVIWKSWNTSSLKFIAIPVFVAALVKCGERTWALMSASREHFRDWVLRDLDRHFTTYLGLAKSTTDSLQLPQKMPRYIPDAQLVCDAFSVFEPSKFLFAEFIVSCLDQLNNLHYFKRILGDADNYEYASRIIEVELGFMYDLLHTKTTLFYSHWRWATSFRIASILSIVSAFIAFSIIDKRNYFRIEVLITYVLLAVAIALELYAVIVLLSSDWAVLWIYKPEIKNREVHRRGVLKMVMDRLLQVMMNLLIYKIMSALRWCHVVPADKRWSNSMSQLNLISICLEEKETLWHSFQKKLYELLEKHRNEYQEDVSDSLKVLICDRLKDVVTKNFSVAKKEWIHRGDKVAEQFEILDLVTFDHRILVWHIATTICYNYNPDNDRNNTVISESDERRREMSMKLSNYMMCLLITSPFMLPNGISRITYEATRAEASNLLKKNKKTMQESTETRVEAACKILLKCKSSDEVQGDQANQDKSDLSSACRLAESLCKLKPQTHKWDIISSAWVEMLAHAASRCTWNNHARKLIEGGELLTHVWLLMAHLGITDHFLQASESSATTDWNPWAEAPPLPESRRLLGDLGDVED